MLTALHALSNKVSTHSQVLFMYLSCFGITRLHQVHCGSRRFPVLTVTMGDQMEHEREQCIYFSSKSHSSKMLFSHRIIEEDNARNKQRINTKHERSNFHRLVKFSSKISLLFETGSSVLFETIFVR